jgi:tRNA modification GTPase
MNALLGKDRAIVSSIAGTTRDVIEEGIVLDGIIIRLVDTAGLRETLCPIEKEGVSRAKNVIKQADAIIYVMDTSQDLVEQQMDLRSHMTSMDFSRMALALNKQDLPHVFDQKIVTTWMDDISNRQAADRQKTTPVIEVSALTGDGIGQLRKTIASLIGIHDFEPLHHPCISERHRNELLLADQALRAAEALLDSEKTMILAAEKMRLAVESLGRITGKIYTEDLLDRVFRRFCVGK